MKTLNIIGSGNLAKTLAKLWHNSNSIKIQDILNRNKVSSEKAIDFIGAGKICLDYNELRSADFYLIATPDSSIEICAKELKNRCLLPNKAIIFHCSGALASSILKEGKKSSFFSASVHPVHSFANPEDSVKNFSDTCCSIEGEQEALAPLKEIFKKIGGKVFEISAESKVFYHSAMVFSSNYLVSLIEISLKTLEQSGFKREDALTFIEPLAKGTLNNIFKQGTQDALSGPIARGDDQTVIKQLKALSKSNDDSDEIYRLLGKVALKLAKDKGRISVSKLGKISELLG